MKFNIISTAVVCSTRSQTKERERERERVRVKEKVIESVLKRISFIIFITLFKKNKIKKKNLTKLKRW